VVFEAVGKILPRNAVWYASNLKRTHQTAAAIWAAGFPKPSDMPHVNAFAEQHLGQLQGMNRAAFYASLPVGSHWLTGIDEPAPGGESFMDLYNRVCGAIERINAEQVGRDVIVVAHGGTIKAAVGLALGGLPEKGLTFDIDNCSVTRLDHLSSANYTGWRLPMVNQQPWIADASHNAMRQPAGPEVKPPETNLA
jgi:broad specificity phosphatase PhoE